jgi:hypothetical protein
LKLLGDSLKFIIIGRQVIIQVRLFDVLNDQFYLTRVGGEKGSVSVS